MKNKNPFFKNPERPVYEIGGLLRQLPEGLVPSELTSETRLVAEAVRLHALNGVSSVFSSIQALGELMTIAAGNRQEEISPICQMDIAFLFQNLGSEGQFMSETENSMRYLLGINPCQIKEIREQSARVA